MANKAISPEWAVHSDALLKKIRDEGYYYIVGIDRAMWASLISNGYIERAEKRGEQCFTISDKGRRFLDNGGFWRQVSRAEKVGYKERQLLLYLKRITKSIQWKWIERVAWIASIMVAIALFRNCG